MRVLFRTDSGKHIGQGHLHRCRNLARIFLDYGWEVHWVHRAHFGSGEVGLLSVVSHELFPGVENFEGDPADYSQWLGVSEEKDLYQTLEVIKKVGLIDVFVSDHYSLGHRYHKEIPARVKLVFDDFGSRFYYCDFLLNQNPNAAEGLYEGKVESGTQFLLGPEFAPLDYQFAELRQDSYRERTVIAKIGVFLGGSDPMNETLKIIKAALASLDNSISFDVLLSEKHPTFSEVVSLVKSQPNFSITSFHSNISEFWSRCDVVIGAVGVSSWERSCLGVPSLIVVGAENQKAVAEYLHKNNLSHLVGSGDALGMDDWRQILLSIVTDIDRINELGQNSFALTDGNGAKRVYKTLEARLNT